MIILFINHKKSQCGVYEFGRNIGLALEKSSKHTFLYFECGAETELEAIIKKENPVLIIYNYHPSTMAWLNVAITKKYKCPQIGIIHEVTQQVADKADNSLFNFHIAHDPTLLLKNPLVFKAGRLIPRYENKFEPPPVPTIGSFGFAGKKGQRKIVEMVQEEFDEAIIRLNIPFASFGDRDGAMAKAIADDCRSVLRKPNVKLEISHAFLEESRLLDFLAQNTINLFLYEDVGEQRGVSGATDLALAVKRPIGISFNTMFRHVLDAKPSICVADTAIKTIIANGVAGLEKYYLEWSEEVLCWDYERITNNVLAHTDIPQINVDGRLRNTLRKAKRFVNRKLGEGSTEEFSWITDTSIKKLTVPPLKKVTYAPASIPDDWSLNNILDNKARKLYAGTIEQMFGYLPDLMKRKIPEANVQQAFVLDTVYKVISTIEKPTVLCVGSFEDSASESLKILGFDIEEVDPMVNYDLGTFMTKPTTIKNSYDVVFSTSVIEHVELDDEFLMQIAALLKKGGVAILTCDYCDTYKDGDPKPAVDFRFYTQKHIKEKLLPKLVGCRLIDEPQWDCLTPDFYYDGFNYTFGTIVLKKLGLTQLK